MTRLLLTDQERQRFSAWLRAEAEGHVGMAKQMEELPNMAPMALRERQRAAAKTLIAMELDSTESMSIGP